MSLCTQRCAPFWEDPHFSCYWYARQTFHAIPTCESYGWKAHNVVYFADRIYRSHCLPKTLFVFSKSHW